MIVLGIESSCDETAAALVEAGPGNTLTGTILSHVVPSQIALHQVYGGVVPEVASRSHLAQIGPVVDQVFAQAGLGLHDIDAVAVTGGPGLIGGVMVGVMFAKALALAADKPLIAVNHLEGHALMPRFTNQLAFPYLLLLMSGGHTQFLLARGVGDYQLLGNTRDDALGETFDKTGRLLGFPYPGGPAIEKAAQTGNPHAFVFPKPLFRKAGCDFSFSGLKTALSRTVSALELDPQTRSDIAASFQETVALVLEDRMSQAIQVAQDLCPNLTAVVLAGGVAANRFLYGRLAAASCHLPVVAPPAALCTDNGVMIAWAGIERLRLGLTDNLNFAPRPRWPLAELRVDL